MCNLYSITKDQAAIRELTEAMVDPTGNVPPIPAVFPDRMAPAVSASVKPHPFGTLDGCFAHVQARRCRGNGNSFN